MTDDFGRELGHVQGKLDGHEASLKALWDELRKVSKKQDEILLAMAERKGVERVAVWLAGAVGAMGATALGQWIKAFWPTLPPS